MRIGEALGLEIEKHVSSDFSTLYIRQEGMEGADPTIPEIREWHSGHRSANFDCCGAQGVRR